MVSISVSSRSGRGTTTPGSPDGAVVAPSVVGAGVVVEKRPRGGADVGVLRRPLEEAEDRVRLERRRIRGTPHPEGEPTQARTAGERPPEARHHLRGAERGRDGHPDLRPSRRRHDPRRRDERERAHLGRPRHREPEGDDAFILHPGEFVLASTYEVITLPEDVASRLEGKSSLGRLGLLTHSTAGFIDPGFSGHVTLELSNVATLPIKLWPGMKIGQLCMFRLSSPAEFPYGSERYGSRYQGQRGPTASRSYVNFHRTQV